MKKLFLSLILLLVAIFSLPASASAATSAGIKPGSFWYNFDIAFEKINLFFIFNSESKARKSLEYADERLAEVEAVAESDNTDAVKTAITNYESNIAFATEKSKDVAEPGKAEALFVSIADNNSKHQEILAGVLAKVPDEAKEAITKAIEMSRKGQEEAMTKIAELKSEIDRLKKEVVELKEKKTETDNTNQSSEIEKLKREIEELKNTKTTSPVVDVNPKPQPKTTTDGSSSQRQNYDQELSQLIAQTRQNISVFNQAVDDTNNFISIVRNDMNKYSSDIIIQQSGQELINEANNLISISRKLVEIETIQLNKLSSYLGLNIIPPTSEFSSIVTQYQSYYGQYESSKARTESLMKIFVLNEKSALERLTQQTRQQIEDLKAIQNTPSQTYADPQIESALSQLRTDLNNAENKAGVSSRYIALVKEKVAQDWMKQNPNIFSSSVYISQLNAILSSYGLYYMVIPQ